MTPGTKLGPYEILSRIGAGGMGEVYRARDTNLGRDVAIKVLPEAFVHDAERMARFQREAKFLASLNHPNIASIYGLEDSGSTRALVMELAEGPTLADRIAQGPIPIEDALKISKQIADAFEYAHEKGIIHRDLKPANVKVAADDTVKILDFGLAKALEPEPSAAELANSPTISRMATQAGVLLGTAAYMSPEQAKAKPVDRRADIWAFGCVLYEMLTGKMAFGGDAVTETLAAVLKNDPDWSQLPSATPMRVRVLLQRCLQKDVRQRLQAMGDARISLYEFLSGAPEATPMSGASAPTWRRVLPWGVTIAAVVVATLLAIPYFLRAPKEAPVVVSEISLPAGARLLAATEGSPAVLSPDGRRLAFSAIGTDGRQFLWVRTLDDTTAQPLAGTDGAARPFWSPDSRYLGYYANGKLNRIEASGGPPLALCDAAVVEGGSWGPDGTILFADVVGGRATIYRVSASGGTPQTVLKPDESLGPYGPIFPQFLPDGKHFLFLSLSELFTEGSGIYVGSVDGGNTMLIVRNESNALYAAQGYLLFVRGGTLMAQPFDAGKLKLIGDAAPMAEQVNADLVISGRAFFTVSENGILAYQRGSDPWGNADLLWFDRSGKQVGKMGGPGTYGTIGISPDGSKVAAAVTAPLTAIWVYDIARDVRTRLTFDSSTNAHPAWSPDGKFIAFQSNRSGQKHLYQNAADGTGSTTPLVVDDADEQLPSWSSDGRYLIFARRAAHANSRWEIWALPLFGDRKVFPVVQSHFDVNFPSLSPDGKWLAYHSGESGREEVYVVPFLHGSGKWLVSTNGGVRPRWRRDGKELFYLSSDSKLMAAEITEKGASLTIGRVQPLFAVDLSPLAAWPYDVSPDSKKFLVTRLTAQQAAAPLTLVTNWPALLKKQ